jgi:bifunctional enzyme CysN/CysC
MATGASSADLAVILVDARNGILRQTHRHATIVHLMGIRHVVLAVNKMDLVDWREESFASIEEEFLAFARALGIEHVACIPVSALTGANISARGAEMPWYRGPTLMDYLDTVEIGRRGTTEFRLPVQWVNRPNADFRGFSGTVAGGGVAVGDRIAVLPSRREARVARIVTYDGDPPAAAAGEAVTLVLDREVDISRGDILVAADDCTMEVAEQLQAHMVWVGEEGLIPGRQYLIRMGACATGAKVTAVKYKLDVATQAHVAAKTMDLNDIGVVTLSLDRPLAFDSYAANRITGSFILIDRYSNATIAAGMIDHGLRRATNVVWHETAVDKQVRAAMKSQKPACLWFTGLSGAGKSTVANLVDKRLTAESYHTYTLDGDNVRHGLNSDLGFTETDRVENIRRIAEVAKLMVDAGLIVLVCAISPYRKDRDMARQCFEDGEFIEVFVDTPLDECEARDPKGLYRKARAGQIPNFTGISAPYEAPVAPELRLNGVLPAEQLAEQVFERGLPRPGDDD